MSKKRTFNEAFQRVIDPVLRKHSKLEIKWTPEFGYGLFSKEHISQGNLLLKEQPWFSSGQWSGPENLEPIEKITGSLLLQVLEHGVLEESENPEEWPVMSLCSHSALDETIVEGFSDIISYADSNLDGILDVDRQKLCISILNRIFINGHFSGDDLVVRPLTSLLNHSCAFNAFESSPNSFIAIVDIPAGQQVFVKYGEPEQLEDRGIQCEHLFTDADISNCSCFTGGSHARDSRHLMELTVFTFLRSHFHSQQVEILSEPLFSVWSYHYDFLRGLESNDESSDKVNDFVMFLTHEMQSSLRS